jgi:hypothetical protein
LKPRYVILAVAFVPLLVAAVLMYGHADAPTSVTDARALAEQVFPADLPAITGTGDSAEPGDDAGALYEAALALYAEHPGVLTKTREHDALVDELCGLLIRAAGAGRVEPGFMDGHIPVAIGALPDYDVAVEAIYTWAIYRSADLYMHGERDSARELALAVWVFGRRMFGDNVRLYNRNTGLDMMESAGGLLFEMSVEDPSLDSEVLRAWSLAITDIRRAWQPKLEVMLGIDPHPGDLMNIALNDKDRMFRVEATLRLGIHRYGADRGNQRAMNRAIQEAIESDNPMLAEAGRAADALSLKEKRRLY